MRWGDYLQKKRKKLSLKVLSHWKGKAADQLSFSFCLFLTHKLHTKTHSMSPPHCKTVTHTRTKLKRKEDEAYCYCRASPPVSTVLSSSRFVTTNQITVHVEKRTKKKHPLIKNYSNRLGAWWLDDVFDVTSKTGSALLQVPVFTHKNACWRLNAILNSHSLWS